MERLTYDFCIAGKHCWQVKGADNLECGEVCKSRDDEGCNGCPIADAFDRLAAIEDILGDDYDLGRLKELLQADRDGRCVVLPCKIGDTVYDIQMGKITEKTIISIPFLLSKSVNHLCLHAINNRDALTTIETEDLGKTVFLTRKEAEAALERMEGEEK